MHLNHVWFPRKHVNFVRSTRKHVRTKLAAHNDIALVQHFLSIELTSESVFYIKNRELDWQLAFSVDSYKETQNEP